MKTTKNILLFLLVICFTRINAQEKKIKFNKGTLRICSAKNFKISGYDGNEVVVKSLHKNRNLAFAYITKGKLNTTSKATTITGFSNKNTNKTGVITQYFSNQNKKEGLKKLGKKNENRDLGIYFKIEEKDGELVFSDEVPSATGQLVMYGNESYEIKVPNSLKLIWESNGCVITNKSSQKAIFYNSNPSSLTDFNGEVDINSNLSNIKLTDVTGPVSIITIGGNVTIEFDKKKPSKLYSVYSNNGFIDITLPSNTSISLDVKAESVYSDLDINVESEKEVNDFGHIKTEMKLKKGSGKVKMKLDANYGSIYLRKKQ